MRFFVLMLLGAFGCDNKIELLSSSANQTLTCMPGTPIRLGGGDDASCAGALAAKLGSYAICTCDELDQDGRLNVGTMSPMGSQGTQDDMPKASVGSDVGMTFSGGGHIIGDLHSGGDLTNTSTDPIFVTGDAFVAGNESTGFQIDHTLYYEGEYDANSAHPAVYETNIALPCDCSNTIPFDIAKAVADRQNKNDNASLDPGLISDLTNLANPLIADLTCGEFYFPGGIWTAPNARVTSRVHGHVGLFVQGNVYLQANWDVVLDDGAELDIVVSGTFSDYGQAFGSFGRPAHTRLWVAGSAVQLGQVSFNAFVYAPNAAFISGDGMGLSGVLRAKRLSINGNANFNYDPSVTDASQACGSPQ